MIFFNLSSNINVGIKVKVLVNTGSYVNMINESFYKKIVKNYKSIKKNNIFLKQAS